MKKTVLKNIFLLAAAMALFSCKKDPVSPPIAPVSDIPLITLTSVTPTTRQEFTGPITFNIHYLDGNGDLGNTEADSMSLYIIDNRGPLTNKFHVQPLTPSGADMAIEGDLQVDLNNVIVLDTSHSSEIATFTVKLKDRAGNWSNEVTSGNVTITK